MHNAADASDIALRSSATAGFGYGSLLQKNGEDAAKETTRACDEGLRPVASGAPWKGQLRACLLAGSMMLLVISEGYDIGVTNGVIVRIREDLGLSTLQISMFVSVMPLAVIPGALLIAEMTDAWGRRPALWVTCLLLVLGPTGMAISPNFEVLLFFRILVGVAIGAGLVVVSLYIAELAPTEMRGWLVAMEEVALTMGMLLGYLANYLILGMEHDWRLMIIWGSLFPLALLLLLLLPIFPESPRWLVAVGRDAEAAQALLSLLGEVEARESLVAMRQQQAALSARKLSEDGVSSDGLGAWTAFPAHIRESAPLRSMLLAGCTVALAYTLCGYLPVVFYSSTVMKTTMGEEKAFAMTFIMGVVKLAVALVTMSFLERLGRRPLLLASTAATSMACVWLAASFSATGASSWWGSPEAQAAGFSLFMVAFAGGLGPLWFVYVAEVFSTEWRAKMMSICIAVSRSMGFASLLVFPLLVEYAGAGVAFGIQAAASGFLAVMVWAFVYETGGRSLEALEEASAL